MNKLFNFAQAKGKWHRLPSFNLGGGAKLYKNFAQKLLAVSLCMAIMLLGVPLKNRTMAATSGKCGDNLTWKLTENGAGTYKLSIEGSGPMYNYSEPPSWTKDFQQAITEVSISDDVTSIGNLAFGWLPNVSYFKLPSKLTRIGKWAFYGWAPSRKFSVIPAGVTEIGERAFNDCEGLQSINVSSQNPTYTSVDGVLFTKDKKTLIAYPAGKQLTNYSIPDGVVSIGKDSFAEATKLRSISIPSSVASIGADAFLGAGLLSIDIPDSVTSLGSGALRCGYMTSVHLGSGVSTADFSGLFWGCGSLRTITISENNPNYSSVYGAVCTKDKKRLVYFPAACPNKTFIVDAGIDTLGSSAFSSSEPISRAGVTSGGVGLMSLESVISAGIDFLSFGHVASAATYVSGLESLVLPFGLTTIEDYVFDDCITLKELHVPCSWEGNQTLQNLFAGETGVRIGEDGTTFQVLQTTGNYTTDERKVYYDVHQAPGATCVTEAYCLACEKNVLDPNNHSWNEGEVISAASCSADGLKKFTCTYGCGKTKEEPIPTLPHTFTTYTYNNDASCTSSGTKTSHCEVCGALDTVTDPDHPATDHNWVNGICSFCGDMYVGDDKLNAPTGERALQLTVASLGMTLVLALGIMLRLLTSKRTFED